MVKSGLQLQGLRDVSALESLLRCAPLYMVIGLDTLIAPGSLRVTLSVIFHQYGGNAMKPRQTSPFSLGYSSGFSAAILGFVRLCGEMRAI